MNTEKYNGYFEDVLEFNETIGFNRVHINNIDAIKLYEDLTVSEIDETIAGIKDGDDIEVMDGVFDVFVTASFLNYLNTGLTKTSFSVKAAPMETGNAMGGLHHLMLMFSNTILSDKHYIAHSDIRKMIYYAESIYGFEAIEKLFTMGIKSNNTKFIFDISAKNRKKELAYAQEKYADTKFTDIVLVKSKFRGKPVYLLRADNGKGKMLKPSTFIDLDVRSIMQI